MAAQKLTGGHKNSGELYTSEMYNDIYDKFNLNADEIDLKISQVQANTVARAPMIITNYTTSGQFFLASADRYYSYTGTGDVLVPIADVSQSTGRKIIVANKSASIVQLITGGQAQNHFWDIDGNYKNTITLPANSIRQIYSDGVNWVVSSWH